MKDVLRSEEVQEAYMKERSVHGKFTPDFFQEKDGKEYIYWRLIENDFPYDLIAEKHFLLSPRRNFANDWEMSDEERQELFDIKKQIAETLEFDSIYENVPHNRTLPGHYHLHLVKYKYVTDFNKKLDK